MPHEIASERNADSLTPLSSPLDPEQVRTMMFDDSTLFPKGNTMPVNFESLAQAEKSQAVADHDRYQLMLRDLAAGNDRDEKEILEICRRVDRDVAMLEDDVKWRKKRDEMIEVVRKKPEIEAEQIAAEAELDRLQADFAKLEAEHEEKCWPLRAKQNRTKQQLREIWMYRNELERDCRDRNIFDELELLSAQKNWRGIQYLEGRCGELKRQIMFAQQEIDRLPDFKPGLKEKKRKIKARIKDIQFQYEKAISEISELQREDAKIEAREAELREAMIFA